MGLSRVDLIGKPIAFLETHAFDAQHGVGEMAMGDRCCRFPFKLSLSIFHVVTDLVDLTARFSAVAARAGTHMMFEGHVRRTGWFAPFIWHNLAFDPFNLAPSAQQSGGLLRWAISTRFLTP